MPCECESCVILRRLQPLLDKANPEELKAFGEFFTMYEHASMEAGYWEMKYKGTWPGDGED